MSEDKSSYMFRLRKKRSKFCAKLKTTHCVFVEIFPRFSILTAGIGPTYLGRKEVKERK